MENIEPLGSTGLAHNTYRPSPFTFAASPYHQSRAKKSWVSEIQGLYGPVSVSETLVQKIWLKQDFMTDELTTSNGKTLRVHAPGRWNLHEGPDFKEAVLEIDGQRTIGDVEVHFYPQDWRHHGHHKDENYNRVVLHVLLFKGHVGERPVHTASGKQFDELCLLEYLHHDIEAYAAQEALRALAHPDECTLLEWMLSRALEDRQDALFERAHYRWRQKCRFAEQRLNQLGWEGACHQYAMEVLGYSRNRAPMSRIALAYPLALMRTCPLQATDLFEQQRQRWRLAGLRPANHPKHRLNQYLSWVGAVPDWPKVLRDHFGEALLNITLQGERCTTIFRKAAGLAALRRALQHEVVCNHVAATRLDTMMVDAFLPLYAAFSGERLFEHWFHWYVGDMPRGIGPFLKSCHLLENGLVACNGLYQGALQCFHEI